MRQGEGSGAAKPDRPQVSIPNCRISSSLFKIQNSLPLAKKGLAVQETASPPVLQKAVFGALTDLLRENTTLARLLATKWHFTGTDFFVALACALFSYAAVQGILLLCPMGCGINTDLQNYAQVLEVSRNPAPFAADPLVNYLPHDPGLPNLLTILAGLFPKDTTAISLVLAGGLAIFAQLFCWYICGRVLFGRAGLAVLLTLLSSITWYWCFGTYWGATHEEAVPRIFFNALWAFLLLLSCRGLERSMPRYLCCILTGLGVFVHSVSAFMCGGIFLTLFFLLPVGGWKHNVLRHLASILLCVVLLALPILAFLGMRVTLEAPFPGSYNLVRTIFAARFAHDWGNVWERLLEQILLFSTTTPLIPLALAAMVFLFLKRRELPESCRPLATLLPLMLIGVAAVCLVCSLEMYLAPRLGRMSMGQEILRGTRFIIPVCLVAITCVLLLFWRRLPPWSCTTLVLATTIVLLCVSPDRMVLAARYYVCQTLHLPAQGAAEQMRRDNTTELDALLAIKRLVPKSEPIFSPDNTLSVRYVARHPLHPVHKDGIILYYARDYALAWQWLREQEAFARNDSLSSIWESTNTKWMLVHKHTLAQRGPEISLAPVYENSDWLLFCRDTEAR